MLSISFLAIILLAIPLFPVIGNDEADSIKTAGKNLYLKVQYAGNIGLVSVGLGKEFCNDKLSFDLNYGYLPESVNGVRVHTFALKPALMVKKFNLSGFMSHCYIGASFNYGITANTYLRYPDYYPKGYYYTNALHVNPFLGMGIRLTPLKKKLGKISVYTELGTIDYEIWQAIKNKEINLVEIWNLCFGLAFQFRE